MVCTSGWILVIITVWFTLSYRCILWYIVPCIGIYCQRWHVTVIHLSILREHKPWRWLTSLSNCSAICDRSLHALQWPRCSDIIVTVWICVCMLCIYLVFTSYPAGRLTCASSATRQIHRAYFILGLYGYCNINRCLQRQPSKILLLNGIATFDEWQEFS